MNANPKQRKVSEILLLKKRKLLEVDPEYQRGPVWKDEQKQYFIDSILRGYHVPLIYLHFQQGGSVNDLQVGDRLYIIDGQQRVQALYEYSEGAFPLLDPKNHPGQFPKSLIESPCPWAGRDIHQLDEETRSRFFDAKLSTVDIKTEDENEVRDLFIRLQGGKPLTPQEQRDAWPGAFGAFVFLVAGKKGIAKYPGQEFFRKLLRANVRANTPNGRQLAAQMIMLFAKHQEERMFCDINRRAVDAHYVKHMGFDNKSELAQQFLSVLNTIMKLLGDGKRPLLAGHQAIHLVLLTGALLDSQYVAASWRPKFADAFDHFTARLARARARERAGDMDEEDFAYMRQYGYKARTSTDVAQTIRDRHYFFCTKMLEMILPEVKDDKRTLGSLEREIVYSRDNKRCRECGKEVVWNEAEIHHIQTHDSGGATTVENAALVHSYCHPKSRIEVQRFAERNA